MNKKILLGTSLSFLYITTISVHAEIYNEVLNKIYRPIKADPQKIVEFCNIKNNDKYLKLSISNKKLQAGGKDYNTRSGNQNLLVSLESYESIINTALKIAIVSATDLSTIKKRFCDLVLDKAQNNPAIKNAFFATWILSKDIAGEESDLLGEITLNNLKAEFSENNGVQNLIDNNLITDLNIYLNSPYFRLREFATSKISKEEVVRAKSYYKEEAIKREEEAKLKAEEEKYQAEWEPIKYYSYIKANNQSIDERNALIKKRIKDGWLSAWSDDNILKSDFENITCYGDKDTERIENFNFKDLFCTLSCVEVDNTELEYFYFTFIRAVIFCYKQYISNTNDIENIAKNIDKPCDWTPEETIQKYKKILDKSANIEKTKQEIFDFIPSILNMIYYSYSCIEEDISYFNIKNKEDDNYLSYKGLSFCSYIHKLMPYLNAYLPANVIPKVTIFRMCGDGLNEEFGFCSSNNEMIKANYQIIDDIKRRIFRIKIPTIYKYNKLFNWYFHKTALFIYNILKLNFSSYTLITANDAISYIYILGGRIIRDINEKIKLVFRNKYTGYELLQLDIEALAEFYSKNIPSLFETTHASLSENFFSLVKWLRAKYKNLKWDAGLTVGIGYSNTYLDDYFIKFLLNKLLEQKNFYISILYGKERIDFKKNNAPELVLFDIDGKYLNYSSETALINNIEEYNEQYPDEPEITQKYFENEISYLYGFHKGIHYTIKQPHTAKRSKLYYLLSWPTIRLSSEAVKNIFFIPESNEYRDKISALKLAGKQLFESGWYQKIEEMTEGYSDSWKAYIYKTIYEIINSNIISSNGRNEPIAPFNGVLNIYRSYLDDIDKEGLSGDISNIVKNNMEYFRDAPDIKYIHICFSQKLNETLTEGIDQNFSEKFFNADDVIWHTMGITQKDKYDEAVKLVSKFCKQIETDMNLISEKIINKSYARDIDFFEKLKQLGVITEDNFDDFIKNNFGGGNNNGILNDFKREYELSVDNAPGTLASIRYILISLYNIFTDSSYQTGRAFIEKIANLYIKNILPKAPEESFIKTIIKCYMHITFEPILNWERGGLKKSAKYKKSLEFKKDYNHSAKNGAFNCFVNAIDGNKALEILAIKAFEKFYEIIYK